jgi:glycosyltransferase involved in cell wall biosynthesis
MKKIIHVTEAFLGGVYNYVKDLSNWQADKYDVYIIFSIHDLTSANYKDQFDSRIHLIELPEIARSFNPFKFSIALKALHDTISKYQPDIVHLHSSFAGFYGRFAIHDTKIKLFYSPHAYGFAMQNCSFAKRSLYKFLEKIAGRKNCLTICDCESEYIESRLVTKQSTFANNGIDIPALEHDIELANVQNSGIRNGTQLRVFMLGRICEQKNPEQFNRIAAYFPNIKFTWIGDGELRNRLTSPNIEITGWVSRKEAVSFVMNNDIFLFTTRWESLSLALLECMYMEKLCIVMDAEGNRDVIKNGINGFLCYSDADVIEVLKKVISSNDINWHEIALCAQQAIVDEYNIQQRNKKLSEIYATCANAIAHKIE